MTPANASKGPILARWQAKLVGGGKPLRFLIAAGANTAFGLAIYPALQFAFAPLQRHYLVALAIAQALSLIFAFCTYKLGVFRTDRANLMREIWAFLSYYLANYAMNWAALPLLVEVASIRPWIAQTLFSLILMTGSYFWHSRVTFRPAGARS